MKILKVELPGIINKMRTQEDINFNQCDKCGKIDKNEDLANCDIEGNYKGLAICDKCYTELENKTK